ncbi:ferritin light chain-like [Erinaceus europaeus]|uniref:Ferritin light chain n=1 Tax=Erinaceus europaeus TaxID=9365 RepID=A0ABM3X0K8_ERIEU|nr:ferritin light chain-like [Erinaceus europaeus]XP_060042364.1 ferritin light chain-like [Erinaceus europaeus]
MQPYVRGQIYLGLDKVMKDALYLHYRAFRLYAPVGLHLLKAAGALEEGGLFLCELSEERQEGYFRLLTTVRENYRGDMLFRMPERKPRKWKGVLSVMEYAMNLEKELDLAVRILYTQASNTGKSELCDLLRTHFLEGEQKVLEQMQAHLGTVRSLEAKKKQSQRVQYSLKPKDEGQQESVASNEPLCLPIFRTSAQLNLQPQDNSADD